jgi:hypothetical protein
MKLFHHCLSTIGLFGTTLLGASLIGSSPAQAIPEAQVIAKLQNIPVYVITDEKGTIVEARISSQGENPSPQVSTGVYRERRSHLRRKKSQASTARIE